MGTNPVVSMPDADRVRAALLDCELVVVSDCVQHTDTTACADILLPAAGWGEKDGTVTNSERRISRQRAFLPAAGEAKPDWWIITQVAQRMGFAEAFPYTKPAQIFREHARLSGFENDGTSGPSTSAHWPKWTMRNTTHCSRCNGRSTTKRRKARSVCSPTENFIRPAARRA